MWCHNARHRSYQDVWVVLTDLNKVCGFALVAPCHGATNSVVACVAAQHPDAWLGLLGLQLLLTT
jgi:peptidyl-tRNA hydrolase